MLVCTNLNETFVEIGINDEFFTLDKIVSYAVHGRVVQCYLHNILQPHSIKYEVVSRYSTYMYVPFLKIVFLVHTSMYWYVRIYVSTYYLVPSCTSMYWYIPKCPFLSRCIGFQMAACSWSWLGSVQLKDMTCIYLTYTWIYECSVKHALEGITCCPLPPNAPVHAGSDLWWQSHDLVYDKTSINSNTQYSCNIQIQIMVYSCHIP